MQYSKFFLISLVAALSAFVAASASVNDALIVKRAALESRMHARARAGHGALKKRVPLEAEVLAKQRIQRAQYKPTRTAAAAPALEKRQLGFGVGTTTNDALPNNGLTGAGTGSNGLGCVCTFGVCVGLGCSTASAPQPSHSVCRGTNYDGCNPGAAIGASADGTTYTTSGGISQCCQSGFTCQKLGPFGASFCLNLPFAQAYNLNTLIASSTFSTQQQFADFLAAQKKITG